MRNLSASAFLQPAETKKTTATHIRNGQTAFTANSPALAWIRCDKGSEGRSCQPNDGPVAAEEQAIHANEGLTRLVYFSGRWNNCLLFFRTTPRFFDLYAWRRII
jgi:hypothetical protein